MIEQYTTQGLFNLHYIANFGFIQKRLIKIQMQFQRTQNEEFPEDTWEMTGKNIIQVQKVIDQFENQKLNQKELTLFRIEEYQIQDDLIVPQKRHLYIKGRNGTIYQNKMLKFRLQFTDRFPEMPPLLYCQNFLRGRFLEHPNIFIDDGEVCHFLLNKKRKAPLLSLLLKCIQKLIYQPNFLSCANQKMGYLYCESRQVYQQKLQDDAKDLQQWNEQNFQ